MGIYIILGALLLGAWVVFLLGEDKSPEVKDKDVERRMQQTAAFSSLNMLKARLGEITDEKVSYKKRTSKEQIYLQAGFKFSYVDHLLVGTLCGVIMCSVFSIALKNVFIMPVFFIIGYHLPFQIVRGMRNKRVAVVDKQVGVFLQLILKRYEVTDDFGKAFRYVAEELKHESPINQDLAASVNELEVGTPMVDVLDHLSTRTANKYIHRLAEYYRIVSDIGTIEARENLLTQAFIQYEENRLLKRTMKEKLSEPVRECYIILGMVPSLAAYQMATNPDYAPFMTGTLMGKIGTTVIISICFGMGWFINAKIGAPIE